MVRSLAEKFTSRKFLACLAGVVIGLCTVFGLEQNTVTTVSGAVVSLASLVTYILAEGKIDAAAVLSAVEILQEELIPQETETPVNPDESANRETPVDPDRPGETGGCVVSLYSPSPVGICGFNCRLQPVKAQQSRQRQSNVPIMRFILSLLADDDSTLRAPVAAGDPMRPEAVMLAHGAICADRNVLNAGFPEGKGIDGF